MAHILVVLGLVMAVLGLVLWIVAAFKESILWGVGCLIFFPFLYLFLVFHWDKSSKYFFMNVGGVAIALVGVFVGGGSVSF